MKAKHFQFLQLTNFLGKFRQLPTATDTEFLLVNEIKKPNRKVLQINTTVNADL
jgi:hypothetical protein